MAAGVIRCSVVSSSAGRRNLCDSQAQLNIVQSKSKSFSYLNSSSGSNNSNNTSSSSCACVRCHIAHTNYCKDTWPVEHKHQPLSAVSLGTLSAKESPLFARRQLAFQLDAQQPSDQLEPHQQQQLSCSHYPLRSATPAYASQKPQIDLSAVEALNIADMPAARINNMDINRNNGYLYNGTIMSPSGEKREHLYKILVIGELGTGKTSFIKRYVHQFFSQNYRATIGVDFALKVLHWDANTIVRLQLWDIAGQERFGNMTRVYYKEAVGAFIVFDVTRSGTFDCVSKWKEDLDSKVQLPDGSPIPCILLANKCDQEKQGIVTQPERMDEYVRENGFAGWFETSAKENINIDEAARALVNKILINDKLITADANDAEKFNLSAADASADAKNKCSC